MIKSLFLNSFKVSTKITLLVVFIISGSILYYKYFNNVPKDKILKIAIVDNNPPFNIKTSNEKLKGFDIDLIKNFFNEMGIAFEVILLEPDEMVSSVKQGLYDVGVTSENELSKTLDKDSLNELLISNPYIESTNIVIKKDSHDKLLKYKKVGVFVSDSYKDTYEDKFKKSQILEYDTFNDMYNAFNNGEVEALILNNLTLKHAALKNKIANYFLDTKFLSEKDAHVLIFPKNSRYFARISKQLNLFRNKNRYKLIYQKWFGNMKQ